MVFIEGDSINHDPTNWWVQSRECVEGMLRSCGFCNVQTVDYGWSRGIFHGFSPTYGSDVDEFLSAYHEDLIHQAIRETRGKDLSDNCEIKVFCPS